MHEKNIELAIDEVKRLLQYESRILEEMMSPKHAALIGQKQGQSNESFTRDAIPKEIEVLKGELSKLENLSMVLAIVGTMKAGKSTVINAIVGKEVLPSRNRPMTAIPTMIRHVPGKTVPELRVNNNEKLSYLIAKLTKHPKFRALANDTEFGDIVKNLERDPNIKGTYQGSSGVFTFLAMMNDLVRLCAELHEPFPFDDFDEIHELPAIDVEFTHLREIDNSNGQLVLLDTPGPNEAKQPHLKRMLEDQLNKASAVLAVLDYTQLKSDADEQVRDEIYRVSAVVEDRMYVLVNKFDQKDRHSDDGTQVKSFVVDELFSRESQDAYTLEIDEEDVYPVSARWAYLANRARNELKYAGELIRGEENKWIEDFGEEAFGRRWEREIEDVTAVEQCAEELWQDSQFGAPLDRVIRHAHSKATELALDSSCSKLKLVADKLYNSTSLRSNSLIVEVNDLNRFIDGIQGDISKLNELEKNSRADMEAVIESVSSKICEERDNALKTAKDLVEDYFKKGVLELGKVERRKRNEEEKQRGAIFWRRLRKELGRQTDGVRDAQDFPANAKELPYDDKAEADKLLATISAKVDGIYRATKTTVSNSVGSHFRNFEKDTENLQRELSNHLNEIKRRMDSEGINLRIPIAKKQRINFPNLALGTMEDTIQSETHRETRRRHRDSLFGRITKWVGTEKWGTEEYEHVTTKFTIQLDDLSKNVQDGLEITFESLGENTKKSVQGPMESTIDELFEVAGEFCEDIRGNLLRSKQDRESDVETKKNLMESLEYFKEKAVQMAEDIDGIHADIKLLGNLSP